jgi:hypothetical protein
MQRTRNADTTDNDLGNLGAQSPRLGLAHVAAPGFDADPQRPPLPPRPPQRAQTAAGFWFTTRRGSERRGSKRENSERLCYPRKEYAPSLLVRKHNVPHARAHCGYSNVTACAACMLGDYTQRACATACAHLVLPLSLGGVRETVPHQQHVPEMLLHYGTRRQGNSAHMPVEQCVP